MDADVCKTCAKCKESKPLSDFYTLASGKPKSDCKQCAVIRSRQWRKERPHLLREWRERKAYGLTFDEAVDRFGPDCAVCGATLARQRTLISQWERVNRQASIDHCHDSGVVRGLLCVNCNTGIGLFKERSDLLLTAVDYLRKYEIFK